MYGGDVHNAPNLKLFIVIEYMIIREAGIQLILLLNLCRVSLYK